jgi:two-component system phosphate regulon response regulator PhoB
VTAADKVGELDYTLVALILFIGPWRAGRIMSIGEPDFSTRALLVEGRATGADRLRWNLERSGFVVERASNGDEALKQSPRFRPHVMLLNWSLPALSGIEVCRRLRALPETRDVGVIMIGRTGDRYVIRALDAGADDYLVEPFSIAELLARMRAVLRRTRTEPARIRLTLGELDLDLTALRVTRSGRYIHLGPTEFRLLRLLMDSPNRVLSREEIIDQIWGADTAVELRTVDVHVRRLREAITRQGDPDVIRTVRAAGYVFDAA